MDMDKICPGCWVVIYVVQSRKRLSKQGRCHRFSVKLSIAFFLTFTHVTRANQTPQRVRAVMTTRWFMKCLFDEAMPMLIGQMIAFHGARSASPAHTTTASASSTNSRVWATPTAPRGAVFVLWTHASPTEPCDPWVSPTPKWPRSLGSVNYHMHTHPPTSLALGQCALRRCCHEYEDFKGWVRLLDLVPSKHSLTVGQFVPIISLSVSFTHDV